VACDSDNGKDSRTSEGIELEPHSYDEAVNHPYYSKQREEAILDEYNSLIKNGTWTLFAIAATEDLEIHQMDVVTAFSTRRFG